MENDGRIDLMTDDLDVEQVPEGNALGSFSTSGSASTASCPTSTAGSASTAACLG